MQTVRCENLKALKAFLATFDDGFLFRGQTSHYKTSNGNASLTSSFARKGCNPTRMYKWSFYASELLRMWGIVDANVDWVQALLQHYGWRSFYEVLSNPVDGARSISSGNRLYSVGEADSLNDLRQQRAAVEGPP